MSLKNLELAHELDIAWIIALWLAIHGGDPGPEGGVIAEVDETSKALAATLAAHLTETYGGSALTLEALTSGAERLGVGVQHHQVHPRHDRATDQRHGVCVSWSGGWICIEPLPVVAAVAIPASGLSTDA